MRLFAAICLSPAVRASLADTITTLRGQGKGTFTRPENLHLTLAFIGETDRVEAAQAALKRAAAGGSFPLTVEGIGCFDDLWWAGTAENEALERLALGVQQSLRETDFPIEERPWRPHITLVRRWRGSRPQADILPVSMQVEAVSLMKSEQVEGKTVYMVIARISL